MKEMGLYCVETDYGCAIREAPSLLAAEAKERREEGSAHFICVRVATEKDIAWVRGMGGYIPEEKK